jgi:hypothetical protein
MMLDELNKLHPSVRSALHQVMMLNELKQLHPTSLCALQGARTWRQKGLRTRLWGVPEVD